MKHHPFTIAGVLILPELLRDNSGLILMLGKVPILVRMSKDLAILDEPDTGILDSVASDAWTSDMSSYIKPTGTYFCPLYDVKSEFSKSTTHKMFGNSTQSCSKPIHGELPIEQAKQRLTGGIYYI